MSLEIRKNYVNPLTMLKTGRNQKSAQFPGAKDQSDKIKDLQSKQQQLQNTLLLMKSTGSDSSGMPPEHQEALEEKLEEISRELQKAKAARPEAEDASAPRPRKDFYEQENR